MQSENLTPWAYWVDPLVVPVPAAVLDLPEDPQAAIANAQLKTANARRPFDALGVLRRCTAWNS
jgi:hypothetical protein